MFSNTYLPHVGGVARSVSFFAQDLRRDGHPVLVIAPTFPGHEEHDETEPDILRVPAVQNFNGSDFSVRIPLPFVVDEHIEAFAPDIIHSHHPYLLGDAALRAARRRNIPLVFTHHTLYEEYTHYITEAPGKLKQFAVNLSTNYANLCDQVIAPSASVARLIRKRGVTVPVAEIPTGVDTDTFAQGDGKGFRKIHGLPPEAPVVGHLGRLAPEKNIDYLAGAMAQLLLQHPDAHFLVVGEGPSEAMLTERFAHQGLTGRLTMTGTLGGQDLVDAYHAMDIFAFASKSETQGMVLTEAMAAGVPVVALDASGTREVVADGRNGRLLDEDAGEEQFTAALSAALSKPGRIADWRGNTRKTAASFDRKRCAEKLLRRYTGAVSARRPEDADAHGAHDAWDKFLSACRSEWELAAQKAEALVKTLDGDSSGTGADGPA
jgi:glycosyltransferase involved in cell wall biosynthesis